MNQTEIKEKMIKNFERECGQYQVVSDQREWAKIKPDDVYSLLTNCRGPNTRSAKTLLKFMAIKKWTITATAHEGGKDQNAALHFSVRIRGQNSHHLYCRDIPGQGLHVYDISQKKLLT